MGAPTDRQAVLAGLRAAIEGAALPPRVAEGCARLAERLERPVRVALIGTEPALREALLRDLVDRAALPPGAGWPTLELGHRDTPRTRATLPDASVLTADALPDAAILGQGPVFLQIGAPVPILRRMTFLHLAVGADPRAQAAALGWAARRADIAVWCTRAFDATEAQIWADAPEAIKAHALMAVFTADTAHADRQRRPREMVAAVAVAPRAGAVPGAVDAHALRRRLEGEIDAALAEDIDAARLLLHRFGLDPLAGGTAATDEPEPAPAPAPAAPPVTARPVVSVPLRAAPPVADRTALLSEPLLYLRRRARALFEMLAWVAADGAEDWAITVLDHCAETAEGLRERAQDWPDDESDLDDLRSLVAEASDTTVLLQVEGGAAQAEDAAAVIRQLRRALEARLSMPDGLAADLPIAC